MRAGQADGWGADRRDERLDVINVSAIRVQHAAGVIAGGVAGGAVAGLVVPSDPSRWQRTVPTAAVGAVVAGAAHLLIGSRTGLRLAGAGALPRASTLIALGGGAGAGVAGGLATTELRIRRAQGGAVILPIPEKESKPTTGSKPGAKTPADPTEAPEPTAPTGEVEGVDIDDIQPPTVDEGIAALTRAEQLLHSLDKPLSQTDTLLRGEQVGLWNGMIMTAAALTDGVAALKEHRPDQVELTRELDYLQSFLRGWGYQAARVLAAARDTDSPLTPAERKALLETPIDAEDHEFFRTEFQNVLDRTPRALEALRAGALSPTERAAVRLDRVTSNFALAAEQFARFHKLDDGDQIQLWDLITGMSADARAATQLLVQAAPAQADSAADLEARIQELDDYAKAALDRILADEKVELTPTDVSFFSKRLQTVSHDAARAAELLRASMPAVPQTPPVPKSEPVPTPDTKTGPAPKAPDPKS